LATLIELMLALLRDLVQASFRARAAIVAENLFLRRQLALYQERKVRRRRPTPAVKLALVTLVRFFSWPNALAIAKPETFVRWHRAWFRRFWRWRSRPAGRRPLPRNLQTLIVTMGREDPSAKDRLVFGVYSRHMKTIGYLGQIDTLFGAPATTRSWNTILSVLRILKVTKLLRK
jgi:hypothetical protein